MASMKHVAAAVLIMACEKSAPPSPTATRAPDPSAAASRPAVAAPRGAPPPAARTTIPTAFFPPTTFDPRVQDLLTEWYGKHLTSMREPSLWAAAVRGETAYRFLWLRTFDAPIAVRVVISRWRAHLVAARTSGQGGYDPGPVNARRERELSRAEVERLESALAAADFDTTATDVDGGLDGAQWIIERADGGAYRLVQRWSPGDDPKHAAFKRACEVFLELAGRDLITGHVY